MYGTVQRCLLPTGILAISPPVGHLHGCALLWYNETLRPRPHGGRTESRLWSVEDLVAPIDSQSEKISGDTLVGQRLR